MIPTILHRPRLTTGLPLLAALACLALPAAAPAQTAASQALACQQLVEALANDGRVPLQGVHFDFNRATLRPDSLPALVAARDAILTLGGSWSFEGHTDSVGSRAYNQTLSEARALSVRDWMVGAGIDPAQVAFEGFSFDRPIADNATEAGRALNRRVEMVGTVDMAMLGFGGPEGVDPCPATLTPGTHAAGTGAAAQAGTAPEPPPISDWTGAGGQDWLPFSYLMTTGSGGTTGWQGDRITMPPGTQPQACQALCLADDRCAAFSFEPAGSFFVQDARCALIGYGTEVNLTRENNYFEGGTFFASGLRPDARILTAESEALADAILADMAEIAALRAAVRLSASAEAPPEAWLDLTLDGHVPADRYVSFVEIAELEDYSFDWSLSRGAVFVDDMQDGRSGRIWTPAPGDYVLRYAIDHPTAGRHVITAQPLSIHAGAAPGTPAEGAAQPEAEAEVGTGTEAATRGGTVEPGIDRPGMDIAQIPMTVADPLACQAVCAADPNCRAWTYVNPGLQGDLAMCWTKHDVPEGFANPCCTSGVMDMDQAAIADPAPTDTAPTDTATLNFPGTVAPGAEFTVAHTGPLYSGDWLDIIAPGNDADMSGGLGWAWATGEPAVLTAPSEAGIYILRYVAEHPQQGRQVLMRGQLVVAPVAAQEAAPPEPQPARPEAVSPATTPGDLAVACPATAGEPCRHEDPETGIVFMLFPGYGITQPFYYETPGGARADRPSLDLVRLADGETVIWVNLRQALDRDCIDQGPDRMCLGVDPGFEDQMAMSLLMASLTGTYAATTPPPETDGAGTGAGEDDFAGVWVLRVSQDGHPRNEVPLVVIELADADEDGQLRGPFRSAPDFPGYEALQGEAVIGFDPDGRMRLHLIAEGGPTLVMLAEAFSPVDWLGEIGNPRSDPEPVLGVAFSRMASPGEDWQGAPWMHGEPDGMEAALDLARRVMAEALGGASAADQAAIAALTGMLGTGSGAAAGMLEGMLAAGRVQPDTPIGQALPMLAPMLEGTPLQGLTVGAALALMRAGQ